MSSIRILVVEDEFIIAKHICDVLGDFGYEVADHVFDVESALQVLEQGQVDLVIADIRLGTGRDGIDLAQEVHAKYQLPFVFLTSHSDLETVQRAKVTKPQGFILKPFEPREIYIAVELAMEKAQEQKAATKATTDEPLSSFDSMFIKVGSAFRRLEYQEILYLKSDRVYVEVHTNQSSRPLLIRESLHALQDRLPTQFCRAHRSFIINLQHVSLVEKEFVRVGGQSIPLARSFRDDLMGRLGLQG